MTSKRPDSKKEIVIKNKTPLLNQAVRRDLDDSLKLTPTSLSKKSSKSPEGKQEQIDIGDLKSKSYSPTVNHLLESLQSLSPNPNLFGCESKQQIRIQKGSKMECVDWESDEAMKTMYDNLKSKKINFANIIAPGQILSNCWFNCFFMVFFISNKGRKFFRYLRQTMIEGFTPNFLEIYTDLKWPFFLLNTYIEASIRGKDDPIRFAETMDTNTLILEIGRILKTRIKNVPKVGEAGCPLEYYGFIIYYLSDTTLRPEIIVPSIFNNFNSYLEQKKTDKIPHILVCKNDHSETNVKLNKVYTADIDGKKYKYELDSAIILSPDKKHYTALLTGNNKEYGFDGASFSRLSTFQWKDIINTNQTWRFDGDNVSHMYYSFNLCQYYLLYYRTK
jgi:hypothetical protein